MATKKKMKWNWVFVFYIDWPYLKLKNKLFSDSMHQTVLLLQASDFDKSGMNSAIT